MSRNTASLTAPAAIERAEQVLPTSYDPPRLSPALSLAAEHAEGRFERSDVARINRRAGIARAARVLAGVAALTVLAGIAAPVEQASAQALPTSPAPVVVVLDGPTAHLRVPVVSTSALPGGSHVVLVVGPGVGFAGELAPVEAEEGQSGVATGTVTADVPAWHLTVGRQTWTLTDLGDKSRTALSVRVQRQAMIPAIAARAAVGGRVEVTGVTASYDPARGSYGPSKAVQVRVQAWTGKTWVTRATARTSDLGAFTAIIPGKAGMKVRAVRGEADRSTAATSATVTTR